MPFSLQISAKILSWPRVCVCCAKTADAEFRAAASRTTGKRVQRTTTSWWDVPYCSACLVHVRAYNQAPTLLVLGIAAGVILWFVASANDAAIAAWLLAIAAIAAGIWAYRSTRNRGAANLSASCSAKTAAIRYVDWHGTFHTFIFASEQYLKAFIAANERKTMSDVRRL